MSMASTTCIQCDRSFTSARALQQHLQDSRAHAVTFDHHERRREFNSEQALRPHVPDLPVHTENNTNPYGGVLSSHIQPVFSLACSLRRFNPQVSRIIAATQTVLEIDVVSAIIEGALRLPPHSSDPAEAALRKEKSQAKNERALRAEADFVDIVRTIQPHLIDEMEQKQAIQEALCQGRTDVVRMTPDILFPIPTVIHGVLCHWIEYKNSFGFRRDPFVFKKNRKQYQNYAAEFGSGMVVYKVGYETDLLRIEGVTCFREAEITNWISRTPVAR